MNAYKLQAIFANISGVKKNLFDSQSGNIIADMDRIGTEKIEITQKVTISKMGETFSYKMAMSKTLSERTKFEDYEGIVDLDQPELFDALDLIDRIEELKETKQDIPDMPEVLKDLDTKDQAVPGGTETENTEQESTGTEPVKYGTNPPGDHKQTFLFDDFKSIEIVDYHAINHRDFQETYMPIWEEWFTETDMMARVINMPSLLCRVIRKIEDDTVLYSAWTEKADPEESESDEDLVCGHPHADGERTCQKMKNHSGRHSFGRKEEAAKARNRYIVENNLQEDYRLQGVG